MLWEYYDNVDRSRGLNITIQTTAKNDKHGYALLKKFNVVFDDVQVGERVIDEEGNIDLGQLEESHLVTRSWGPGMTCQAFSRAFKTVMMGTVIPVTADKVKLRFSFTKPKDISDIFNIYTDGLIAEIVNQVDAKCDAQIKQSELQTSSEINKLSEGVKK